jgi:hypothetical protein
MSLFNTLNKIENNLILKKILKNIKYNKINRLIKNKTILNTGSIVFIQMIYNLNNKVYKETFTGLCISSNYKTINVLSIISKVLVTKLIPVKNNLLKKFYVINYSFQFIKKYNIYKKSKLNYIYKFKSKKISRTFKRLLKRFSVQPTLKIK